MELHSDSEVWIPNILCGGELDKETKISTLLGKIPPGTNVVEIEKIVPKFIYDTVGKGRRSQMEIHSKLLSYQEEWQMSMVVKCYGISSLSTKKKKVALCETLGSRVYLMHSSDKMRFYKKDIEVIDGSGKHRYSLHYFGKPEQLTKLLSGRKSDPYPAHIAQFFPHVNPSVKKPIDVLPGDLKQLKGISYCISPKYDGERVILIVHDGYANLYNSLLTNALCINFKLDIDEDLTFIMDLEITNKRIIIIDYLPAPSNKGIFNSILKKQDTHPERLENANRLLARSNLQLPFKDSNGQLLPIVVKEYVIATSLTTAIKFYDTMVPKTDSPTDGMLATPVRSKMIEFKKKTPKTELLDSIFKVKPLSHMTIDIDVSVSLYKDFKDKTFLLRHKDSYYRYGANNPRLYVYFPPCVAEYVIESVEGDTIKLRLEGLRADKGHPNGPRTVNAVIRAYKYNVLETMKLTVE